MVGAANAQPTIGVSDLEKATAFYGGVLGLKVVSENPYEVVYQSGNGQLSVYKTEYAGTNKATYATWEVADIAAEAAGLKDKGVMFEQYDMPGVTRDGDIHTLGDSGEKAAWFTDPDGNILCLHELGK
ncbi:MAG TPA: VOC family protein [Candidatus Saccharimonadales bacterium]|nr:VOC family protein [Candidatus Saccharimonadales bacterium]